MPSAAGGPASWLIPLYSKSSCGIGIPCIEGEYQDWLRKSLSGYSFNEEKVMVDVHPPNPEGFKDYREIQQVNGAEAIAEAFAHVECDPASATDAEKAFTRC